MKPGWCLHAWDDRPGRVLCGLCCKPTEDGGCTPFSDWYHREPSHCKNTGSHSDKQQNNKQPGTEDANRNVELNQTYFVSSLATDLTYLSLEYRITLVTCSTADKDTSQRNHPWNTLHQWSSIGSKSAEMLREKMLHRVLTMCWRSAHHLLLLVSPLILMGFN